MKSKLTLILGDGTSYELIKLDSNLAGGTEENRPIVIFNGDHRVEIEYVVRAFAKVAESFDEVPA